MGFDYLYLSFLLGIPALLALAYALRVLQKGRPSYDRVNRQGGSALLGKRVMEMGYWALQPFARLLVFIQVTPNQISWTSLLFGLLAGLALAFGHFGFGAGLTIVSALLDSLDGIVARMTGTSSEAGEVLDSAMDRAVEFFFFGGLVVYYREVPALVVLTLIALLSSFMVSYSSLFARVEKVAIQPSRWAMRRPERMLYLTLGAALSPVTIPWLERTRDLPVAIGHPMVFALGLVAVFGGCYAIEQFAQIIRGVREQEALRLEDSARAPEDLTEDEGEEGAPARPR
jgi:CDP-diacylglycerol---glycerol-3-phosphate 3-phosphatidyltransferase